MAARGDGRLWARLGTAIEELDGQFLVLDSVRDREDLLDQLRDLATTGPISVVFADDQLLFVVRIRVGPHRPCPRCVLRHMVTTPDQVDLLEAGERVSPAEDALELADRAEFLDDVRAVTRDKPPTVVIVDAATGETVRSTTLTRHPACLHEGYPGESAPPGDLSSASEVRDALSDPRFGLLRRVTSDQPIDGFPFHIARVDTLNAAFHEYPGRFTRIEEAGGAGADRETAVVRAVMEGIERYAMLGATADASTGTESSLDASVVPPDRFFMYSDWQYDGSSVDYPRYDPEREHRWVPVRDLEAGGQVFVLEGLARFLPASTTDFILVETTSNGCAAHFSKSAAIQGGVLELFERDAMMYRWFERSRGPHFDPESLTGWAKSLVEEAYSRGYEVSVADVTRFEPFRTVVVTFVDPDESPYVVPGAGCAFDPVEAVESALLETFQTMIELERSGDRPVPAAEEVTKTEDHLRFYQDPDRIDHLAPFTEPTRTVPLEADGADGDLTTAVEALSDLDVRVMYADRTPSWIEKRGLSVVRTLSPDLVPITFGHRRHRLEHPVHYVPDDRPADVPHPFP